MNKEIEKLKTDYMLLSHQHSQGELELSIKTLENKALREELEKLRAWKESAMKTLADVDLQECGKVLNIGLGQSIPDKIVPGIKELKAENEKLREENERLKAVNISLEKTIENMAYLEMDTDRQSGQLIIENAQYKEALELVKLDLEERGKEYWDIYKIAKEALKG